MNTYYVYLVLLQIVILCLKIFRLNDLKIKYAFDADHDWHFYFMLQFSSK